MALAHSELCHVGEDNPSRRGRRSANAAKLDKLHAKLKRLNKEAEQLAEAIKQKRERK
jgi:hypothetical protein